MRMRPRPTPIPPYRKHELLLGVTQAHLPVVDPFIKAGLVYDRQVVVGPSPDFRGFHQDFQATKFDGRSRDDCSGSYDSALRCETIGGGREAEAKISYKGSW